MKNKHKIFIAGAGGIGKAAALLLREMADFDVDLLLGDINAQGAKDAADWVKSGSKQTGAVDFVHMPAEGDDAALEKACEGCSVLLDCLPGGEAPRMARLARKLKMHYANLTEYVAETDEVMKIAEGAEQGFVLQTGLAPGYIGVLANHLYKEFCAVHEVEKVEYVTMKVGALTRYCHPPHYYGYTWSPIGVATEYVKPAVVIRDYKKTTRPSLSKCESLIIDGVQYEADLTSGGAADLPDAFSGICKTLDYKTIRYPGHYAWVSEQLKEIPEGEDRAKLLDEWMQSQIPMVEDDLVVVYAAVEGYGKDGRKYRKEKALQIYPMEVGGKTLKAIQTTTAAPLVECARMLLQGDCKGVVLQSQIETKPFLNGLFVKAVYGAV